jgi:pyruvyltransferase
VADAYGIQSTWLKFSDKATGDGFKFRDYFMSVGRKDREALVVTEKTTIEDIYKNFYDYKIDIDLDKLLEVCPFKK